ncbi:RNA-directed DNA polymerase from mobile element jockey [Lucilia cuprina]|nr:RNA-directed DNA polymerase from mobile element jockey [Lucilia cuprina]
MLRLIRSFLTNRRVIVKGDGFHSEMYSIDNGVPQGSPLSVVMFVVYANSLAKLIENTNGIDYFGIYADNIFAIASGTPENVISTLSVFNNRLQQWAVPLGSLIPTSKSEVLHVCRKRLCRPQNIVINNTQLEYKTQLKILGIVFTKTLSWNEHIKNLLLKLGKICSKGPHIETALGICKALVYGIIQHGITYGWTSKRNTQKLNASLNNCLRTASGLLRATPIDSLRIESVSLSLESLLEKISIKLSSRSITDQEEGLHETFWYYLNHLLCQNKCSIFNIIALLKTYKIPIPLKPERINTTNKINIDAELAYLKKNETSPEQFKSMLAEKKVKYSPDIILYTDGSYQDGATAFAVVKQTSESEFSIIKQCILPLFTGIFKAELSAVEAAVSYAKQQNSKVLIYTDSLSTVYALSNNKKGIYNNILMKANTTDNITLIWKPSHIGKKEISLPT